MHRHHRPQHVPTQPKVGGPEGKVAEVDEDGRSRTSGSVDQWIGGNKPLPHAMALATWEIAR